MCDDIATTVDELRGKGVDIQGEPLDEGWGITTTLVLPGDVEVMLYEPRHRRRSNRSSGRFRTVFSAAIRDETARTKADGRRRLPRLDEAAQLAEECRRSLFPGR
jgi:hypothetical protein